MTRFARAKGSKSSNERVPESATPWNQMKQQLLDKNKEIAEQKNRQHAIDQRNANYKAFLQEKEDEATKNVQWASFPGETPLKIAKKKKSKDNTSFIEDSKQNSFNNSFAENMDDELSDNDETFLALKEKLDKVLSEPKSKINNSQDDDSDAAPEEHSSKVEISVPSIKTKKTKKKKVPLQIESVNSKNDKNISKPEKKPKKRKANEESTTNSKKPKIESSDKIKSNVDTKVKKVKDKKVKKELSKTQNDGEITKNKKVKKDQSKTQKDGEITKNKKGKKEQLKKQKGGDQPKKVIKENLTEDDIRKIEKKKQKKLKQLERRKKAKAELKKQKEEEEKSKTENGEVVKETDIPKENNVNKNNNQLNTSEKPKEFKKFDRPNKFNNKFEKKFPKTKDGKEVQRKKPYLPSKMFINGKEVEVDYIEGFPVKKEDAVRLKKLRKEMISKGLPRSEINIALKLERRRAEKAFAREKKKVCFNCRKSGHNLSECPQLNKDQVATAASGICFKCGSTEHTHFECKVVRGQDFKYAQCFICNEQGHISRQCPDNARGLYPKGGSCNVCGDVTHLKKDCPKYQAQQQHLQSSLNIETIGGSNPDILDNENTNTFSLGHQRPNKIIKF